MLLEQRGSGISLSDFKREQEFNFSEIAELMPALEDTVMSLKDSFKSGDYGLLIGDDRGGRIPTLILRGVINHINIKESKPNIPTIFLKGRRQGLSNSGYKHLSNQIDSLDLKQQGKKALIVTEYMMQGRHIEGIGYGIHSQGLSFDVVSLARYSPLETYRENGVLGENEDIFPKEGYLTEAPAIYNKLLSGLGSNPYGDIYVVKEALSDAILARKDVNLAINLLIGL